MCISDSGWAVGGLGAYLTRPDLLILNVVERARRAAQGIGQRLSSETDSYLRAAFSPMMRDLTPYLDGDTRPATRGRVIEALEAGRGRPVGVARSVYPRCAARRKRE